MRREGWDDRLPSGRDDSDVLRVGRDGFRERTEGFRSVVELLDFGTSVLPFRFRPLPC